MMKFIIFIILVLAMNLYSQIKQEKLNLSDSTNHVYAIIKTNTFNPDSLNDQTGEFLSDFFAHLKSFNEKTDIKVNYFESSKIYFYGKEIIFNEVQPAIILFIRNNSKTYKRFDGVVSWPVLQKEGIPFYNLE